VPLADFTFGDAFLTVLSIFFFVIWIWILFTIISDIFRDHELSGGWKAVWIVFLLFIPFITALVYLITRGGGMRDRAIREQADVRRHMAEYIRETAGTGAGSQVDELHKLADLKERGAISDDEYARMKAKLVG
jgi:ABC-type multidrug transport system fused ATPase/permease subunit